MRYSEIDLQIEDIMWFAVDDSNHVLAFTSGGYGCVPEFVCKSKENTEFLESFFMEKLGKSTQGKLLIAPDGSALAEDSLILAEKGIYSYDVAGDGHENNYVQIASPEVPLKANQLPAEIWKILRSNTIPGDATVGRYLHVEHAY